MHIGRKRAWPPLRAHVARAVAMTLALALCAATPARTETAHAPTMDADALRSDPATEASAFTDGLTELRSSGGVLAVTLRAAPSDVRIGNLTLHGATYNGLYAGPVLRVHPGDLLRILLVNDLPQPTNLHFHGLQTSPLGNSDNVHISVAPGSRFTYEVRVPPTQPPGLYWYHSHVHGLSEQQVMRGLSGALVVDAPPGSAFDLPGIAERLVVLKDMVFDDDTGDEQIDGNLHGVVQSINGRLDSTETIRPGETQLWRFTNQSADRAFRIAIAGHAFRILAVDGERTVEPRSADTLDIPPAGRIEALLDGGSRGTYEILSRGAMTGTGPARTLDRVLGRLVVEGDAGAPMTAIPSVPPPPDLRPAAIDAYRTVTFTQDRTSNADTQLFYVNGKIFDAQRVDFRVPLGNLEEWTIRNDSDDMHVFHIHQLGFQVTEINGKPVAFDGRIDVVRVPERGEVKIRMAFTDRLILGRFMFHCHVLKHEDRGMMGQIEVYDPAQTGLSARLRLLYFHMWWWLHGVPWTLCGLGSA